MLATLQDYWHLFVSLSLYSSTPIYPHAHSQSVFSAILYDTKVHRPTTLGGVTADERVLR